VTLDPQDATTRYLRAQLTFDDVSHSDPQIEADLRQALALKPDFAAANGLLAVYLAANNEKLPEAFAFGQKAVTLEPGNTNFRLALAQVLVRMRRYDDAQTLVRQVQSISTDDNVRSQADAIMKYVTQVRDYEARQRQMQEDAAARAKAFAAGQAQLAAARSGEAGPKSDETADVEKTSAATGSPDPDAPILKRRAPATDVIGIVVQVRCTGHEIEVTAKVAEGPTPLVFRAKDRTHIGYTSNIPTIHDDIDPCIELKGHTAKLIFTPSAVKWLNGELVHIEVEK
jgi:tetratricopeptide (TPR) repeat protein